MHPDTTCVGWFQGPIDQHLHAVHATGRVWDGDHQLLWGSEERCLSSTRLILQVGHMPVLRILGVASNRLEAKGTAQVWEEPIV